jgi:hypothetical protein
MCAKNHKSRDFSTPNSPAGHHDDHNKKVTKGDGREMFGKDRIRTDSFAFFPCALVTRSPFEIPVRPAATSRAFSPRTHALGPEKKNSAC